MLPWQKIHFSAIWPKLKFLSLKFLMCPIGRPLKKLNRERELIGMYLSAHPLDEFAFEINNICNTTTVELKKS